MATLKLNDRGIEVRKLQILLNAFAVPSPQLSIDGHFGLRTEQAVKALQKAKSLTVDGKVGSNTREALGLKPIAAPTPPVIAPLSPWLEIAVAELGVHEDSRPEKHTARILEYHKTTTLKATTDETPWCSSFVNWVMIQSGRKGTNNAMAKKLVELGVACNNTYTRNNCGHQDKKIRLQLCYWLQFWIPCGLLCLGYANIYSASGQKPKRPG